MSNNQDEFTNGAKPFAGLLSAVSTALDHFNTLSHSGSNGTSASHFRHHTNPDSTSSGKKAKTNNSTGVTDLQREPCSIIDGGLKQFSVQTLQQHLDPIVKRLEEIDAKEILDLTPSSQGAALGGSRRVQPIHELIMPPHRQTERCVRYLHVDEQPMKYSAGVFVFPPHSIIPLHDHPGMCVLSRVLYGDLQVKSYDWIEDENVTDESAASTVGQSRSSWLLSRASKLLNSAVPFSTSPDLEQTNKDWKRTRKIGTKLISALEVATLYPIEGNIHEFIAGEHGAAVLDVLLPPYDFDHDRDCTFYKEVTVGKGLSANDGELCWLAPIEQPESFHCISGQFGNLGEADDADEMK